MSADIYEVAFSGGIAEGADPEQVKANVGKMFKADAAKLAQLFSGKRMVIKKNIDLATAQKYQAALKNAGAICELKNLSQGDVPVKPQASQQTTKAPSPAAAPTATAPTTPVQKPAPRPTAAASMGDIAPPPDTDPLHITADQINDMAASLAPVGSDVQDGKAVVEPPAVDISQLSMAPVGSDLADHQEDAAPPPPDTSGLSMVDG